MVKESRRLTGKLFLIEKQRINIFQKQSLEACLIVEYRKETSGTQIKDEFAATEHGRVIYLLMEKANKFSNPLMSLPFQMQAFYPQDNFEDADVGWCRVLDKPLHHHLQSFLKHQFQLPLKDTQMP